MRCWALIVAAGRGARFGAQQPKQFLPLANRPLLVWTIDPFLDCPAVEGVVVVAPPDALDDTRELLARHGLGGAVTVVAGGAARHDSVRAGLSALPDGIDLVAVHDGARPLIRPTLIERVIAQAATTGAALPVVPVCETVKRVGPAGRVAQTVQREPLRLAQTPQVFAVGLLQQCYAAWAGGPATDDAQVVERAGHPVATVPGDPQNIKITVPEDLALAEALLAARGGGGAMMLPRIGLGYDVHRFAPGDELILGGVRIPFDRRLAGHSDADVLCHAAADALLGALALGDIGHHFPPGDERFAGACSIDLLGQVRQMVRGAGFRVGNLDCVIVCQQPRIAPHVAQMRANLATALQATPDRISIKATTTEGLGFAGRSEGIAAYATALMEPTAE